MLLSDKEIKAITDRLLSFTKADDAQVSVTNEDYSHLRFAANSITTSGRSSDTNVAATVWIDKKKGTAIVNETDDASLRAVVEQAEAIARISPVDREYLPTLGKQNYKPSTVGFSQATADLSLRDRAATINRVISDCEESKVLGAGFHQARGVVSASATKNGNFYTDRTSIVSLSLTARTPDGSGSGYFLRNHYDVAKLDTARISREAIRKALNSRGARAIDPGLYTVVLEPQAVADLLSSFVFTFDARSADEGRNAFSAPVGKTKLGAALFDSRINLYSDPQHPELPGTAAAPNGLPAEKIYFLRDGKLENLIYSRFWAAQKDRMPTAGPVNVILQSAAAPASFDAMIKSTERGLLVTRFWYIRSVDPRTALITGLTRDGVWLIERGQIQYPVRNFRFNQSLLQMLAVGNVDLIGRAERVGGGESQGGNPVLLPALKVKSFNFTSQSEAV